MPPESSMYNRVLLVSTVVLSVVVAVLITNPQFRRTEEVKASRDYSGEYQFTNPILDYENVKMEAISLIFSDVSKKVDELKKAHNISYSAVYFRDLDNGEWVGIHEKESFASASLIKLPVLISLFREKESDASILEKTAKADSVYLKAVEAQNFKPEDPLIEGQTYSLLELARRMIQQSDNAAMNILVDNINEKYRKGIFESIGVNFSLDGEEVLVNVKNYAGFFRILFNASYLNREDSETVLGMLSKTTFDKGIVAGVPKGIVVAHKFGERVNYINGMVESTQLHDCGIVYYPEKPYILCLMTRGKSFEEQEAFISDMSKFFYDQVQKSLQKK